MKKHRIQLMIMVISILSVAGCSPHQNPSGEDEADNLLKPTDNGESQEAFSEDFGDMQFGEDAKWPDYIPADIPALEGEIETVMEGGSHIRLFYKNVSKKQVLEYLDSLESHGFNLEYRIYVQEGFPDKSEERKKRNDFDAVDITKGIYHMSITYGADPTYDVYTSGFQSEAIEATTLEWPGDLEGILPPPERCNLVSIYPNDKQGYSVNCKPEDDSVGQDYLTLLESSEFQVFETIKDGSGNSILEKLRYEDLVVFLTPNFGTFLTIDILVEPLPEWPVVFDHLVPRPEGCELTAIIPSMQNDDHIQCKPENNEVLPTYVNILAALGFDELHKFANQNGEIMTIELSNGETTVDISSDSPEIMTVRVSQNSP